MDQRKESSGGKACRPDSSYVSRMCVVCVSIAWGLRLVKVVAGCQKKGIRYVCSAENSSSTRKQLCASIGLTWRRVGRLVAIENE